MRPTTLPILLLSHVPVVLGACKSFHQTKDTVPAAFAASFTEPHRVSPGVACGRPDLTPQFYGYGGVDDAQDQHQIQLACPGPGGCPIWSVGSLRLFGGTNLTNHALANIDETDVLDLALRDAPALQSTQFLEYASLSKGDVSTSYPRCLENGTAGWLEWMPKFGCVSGLLQDCTGNQKSLDGTAVSVCVPGSLVGSLPTILAGSEHLHLSSPREAKAMEGNPTNPGPNLPGAGTILRAHIVTLLAAATGAVLFFGFEI